MIRKCEPIRVKQICRLHGHWALKRQKNEPHYNGRDYLQQNGFDGQLRRQRLHFDSKPMKSRQILFNLMESPCMSMHHWNLKMATFFQRKRVVCCRIFLQPAKMTICLWFHIRIKLSTPKNITCRWNVCSGISSPRNMSKVKCATISAER